MRKKRDLCVKFVTRTGDKSFRSLIYSKVMLRYGLGKITRPKIGPVFCYKLNDEYTEGRMVLWEYYKKVTLLCEYEPYDKPVARVISTLSFLTEEILDAFWNKGIDVTDMVMNDYMQGSVYIEIDESRNSQASVYASLVKPIKVIESKEELAEIQRGNYHGN